ncbi:uncharacterized protein LOC133320172 [Danaus plexippus]|uniref:uncharacterized protein LOC133320172 n=1 Tax=Danaus plexippus TaxID=13037 RepID=UPI002AB2112F|nr:uncharacterized protein LOC133320172 [Danaus plexippus]
MSKPFAILLLVTLCEKSVFSSNLGIYAIRDRLLQFNLNSVKLECVLRIVQQEVECQDYFTVLHQSHYGDQIIEHLSATNCYSFITRTPKPQKWLLRSEAYIILVENVTDFIGSIDKLSKDFAWNAVARFFIVIRQFENMQHLDLFKVLAKFNIYHVHVITSETTDKTLIYTYNPFENNRCGHVDENVIKIDDCKGFIHNELNENEMEDLLRPCPLAVLSRENPPNVIFKMNKKFRHGGVALTGIEQYMLNNIAEKEKFRFSLLQHLPKYPLGFSIGGYKSTKKGSDCYDFIWGYCYGNINVYTAVRHEEEWRKLIQEFGTTTWALIALSYSSVTIFLLIIYKLSIGKINKKYVILRIWGYLHNSPDKELIKIRKLRVLLLTWIWFSFFIVNFYNTALYTLITAPDKRGVIIKPEKLFSSPLKPCISIKFRQWFKLAYNITLPTTSEGDCSYDDTALDAVFLTNAW